MAFRGYEDNYRTDLPMRNEAWYGDDYPRRPRMMPNSIHMAPQNTNNPMEYRQRQQYLSSTRAYAKEKPQLPPQMHISKIPPRRGGGRRLPATPNQPSTLNIDHLGQESGPHLQGSGASLVMDLFNSPRLETSPTRMKNLLQGIRKGHQLDPLAKPTLPPRQQSLDANLRRRHLPRYSRSFDGSELTFEEAVIAGRGKELF